MFETSVVQPRAKARARRPLLFSFSIAAHAAVIITVVATSLASVTLPKRAPNQVTIPVFTHLEPMLGGGSEQKKTTPAATPPVKREVTPATPNVVPNTVVPAAPQPPSTTADAGPASDGPATDAPPGPGVPWGKKDAVLVDGPPAVTPAPPETIYTVSGDVKAPRVLRRVSPPYPELARRARLNGFVILECIIDQSGHIRDAKVLQSSFAAFEQPALDAIRQWEFAPGTLNGQPVNVQFNLTVSFHVN